MNIFRGDTFKFNVKASLQDGTVYKFQPGDIVKVGIKEKISNSKCGLYREIKVEEEAEKLQVIFSHEEMKRCCEGTKLLEVELTDTQGNVYTIYQDKIQVVGDVINE